MIDVRGLMIGNKIKHKISGEVITVKNIVDGYFSDKTLYFVEEREEPIIVGENQHVWRGEVNSIPSDLLKPIELTEDMLVKKCGFKKFIDKSNISETEYYQKDYNNILIFSDNRFWPMMDTGGVEIKYLHQLQNLFHANTGKELDVKL